MREKNINIRRAQFVKKVREMRSELEGSVSGRELPEDFITRLKALKKEEEHLLNSALEEYRRIKLKKGGKYCVVSKVIEDIDDINISNNLTEREKEVCLDLVNGKQGEISENMEELVSGITVALPLGEKDYVCGLEDGCIVFLTEENRKLKVEEIIRAIPDMILSLNLLKSGSKNSDKRILATGPEGYLCLLSKEESLIKKWKTGEENLFASASAPGTALVLGEEGNIYYLEENSGIWDLLDKPLIKNYFATNVLDLQRDRYFLLNVEGEIDKIDIKRINTAEELWEEPLF